MPSEMLCWIDYMGPFELQDRAAVSDQFGQFGSIDFSNGKNYLDPGCMDKIGYSNR
jgi:hypothetical protein